MKKQIFILLLCTAAIGSTVLSQQHDCDHTCDGCQSHEMYDCDDMYTCDDMYPYEQEKKTGRWNRFKNFCKKKWRWFWNNKKISFPLTAAIGAIGWDSARLALGKHKNKTWKQTAKESYVGAASLTMLPVLWGINHFCNRPESCDKTQSTYHTTAQNITIKQYDGLKQGCVSDCGYYAIYNASCLIQNKDSDLSNREKFEKEFVIWRQAVENGRNKKRIRKQGTSDITSGEIEEIIIKNHVPSLREHHQEEGMKSVFLKDNVSIIDNLDAIPVLMARKDGAIGGIDLHNLRNIDRFQKKKTPQVIIFNNSSGDVHSHHNWSWHWFAVKLEYVSDDQIKITVVDSLSNTTDSSTIERLYQLFVNTKIPQEFTAFAG